MILLFSQNKFVSRHRGSCDMTLTDLGPRQIAVRFKRPEGGNNSRPIAEIDARIQGVRLNLSASSIAGITELVEDELRPTPIPATVFLIYLNIDLPFIRFCWRIFVYKSWMIGRCPISRQWNRLLLI